MKTCKQCKKEKTGKNFAFHKLGIDNLMPVCRECRNFNSREYSKTKIGLPQKIYNSQKEVSKRRGYSKPIYSLKELRDWLFSQKKFHKLYDNWKNNNYNTMLKPSIDRINDYKSYSLENIQIMTWQENRDKARADERNGVNNKKSKAVLMFDLQMNKINEFYSMIEAERQTGFDCGSISRCCRGIQKTVGGFIWKLQVN